jgi:hypothetical protein
VCESLRSPVREEPGFAGGMLAPRRITGALKLMLGRFGGGWNEAGRPLGRLACVVLACWTPGGGAIPGAEDMPGGGPEQDESVGDASARQRAVTYLSPGAEPFPGHARRPDMMGKPEALHREALERDMSASRTRQDGLR